ncbi:MAG: YfiR family protein [Gammaproteobacteria bacterium]|nr:YfiR family protein [Gammaproteobacteria bacterium]
MRVFPFSISWLKRKEGICFQLIFLYFIFFSSFFNTTYARDITNEDKIKASYVFNFIRFIDWPLNQRIESSKPIVVCVINKNNQFIKAFSPVVGKEVKGHLLTFRKISEPYDISKCHLLYIDKAEKNLISQLLPKIKKYNILSISDMNAFCSMGGMIGMVTKKGKVKVEINLSVAKAAGFKINSNLLEVATIVSSQ